MHLMYKQGNVFLCLDAENFSRFSKKIKFGAKLFVYTEFFPLPIIMGAPTFK